MSSRAQERRRSGVQLLSAALPPLLLLLLFSFSGKKPNDQSDRCFQTLIRGSRARWGSWHPHAALSVGLSCIEYDCVCVRARVCHREGAARERRGR